MWIHENKRVFGDRLTDNKDRTYLDDMLIEQSEQKFNLQKKQIMNSDRLIYGDFMEGVEQEIRIYKQIDDLRKFQDTIDGFLDDYNG